MMETQKHEPKYINDVRKCYEGLNAGTKKDIIAKNVKVNEAFVTYVSSITKDMQEFGYDMSTAKLPANANKRQRILKMLANGMTDKQIVEQIPTKLNYIRKVHDIYDVVRQICVPLTGQFVNEPKPVTMEQPATQGNLNYLINSNKAFIKEANKTNQPPQISKANSNGAVEYLSLNDYLEDEKLRIQEAKTLSKTTRISKLQKANPKPEKRVVSQVVFIRNPYVVVEVLERANGICERCRNHAPFLKDNDNSPFLEVHHIIPLAEGGDDTVENAIGLCPNCHRQAHYGKSSY